MMKLRGEKTDITDKVYEYLRNLDIAKFSWGIAEELNVNKGNIR